MSAMATRESMLAEEARRDFRNAKVDVERITPDAFHPYLTAYWSMARAWHRWEVAAKDAGMDPYVEAPEWRSSAPSHSTYQRIAAEARLTWDDLRRDGWRSVEHEAVPDSIRHALLGILGWDEDHSGGVFVRHRDSGAPRFAFVAWVADGLGDVRQEIAMQVPICTHEVPLAEGCSVCGVGGR